MTRRPATAAIVASATCLIAACGENPASLAPDEPALPCTALPADAPVSFADPVLESAVRAAASLGPREPLTCGAVGALAELDVRSAGVRSVEGIENLTGLVALYLNGNAIEDVTSLRGLTGLEELELPGNAVADIRPLGWLTALERLVLAGNPIRDVDVLDGLTRLKRLELHNSEELADIGGLLLNPGLAAGDTVRLENTAVPCADVAALRANGVTVGSDCAPR